MFSELTDLVEEVRLTFHAFTEFARQAHGSRIDPGGRAVLEYLSKNVPSTVPTIARSRGVTRQHIQTIVNQLESDGLIEAQANPAHKRSVLFALSTDGEALIQSVVRTEQALIKPIGGALDARRMTEAAETLSELRELLGELEPTS